MQTDTRIKTTEKAKNSYNHNVPHYQFCALWPTQISAEH